MQRNQGTESREMIMVIAILGLITYCGVNEAFW
jgi:hypothetical protein